MIFPGDCDVGKTTLLIAFTTKTTSSIKLSGIFEVYTGSVIVDSNRMDIDCWYTSPVDTADARRRHYCDAGAILICFAADDHQSFKNAKSKWYQEAYRYAPGVPVFLVKTKSDKFDAPSRGLVSPQMGEAARDELGAIAYMECSSYRSKESVQKVFETVAQQTRTQVPASISSQELLGELTCCSFLLSAVNYIL